MNKPNIIYNNKMNTLPPPQSLGYQQQQPFNYNQQQQVPFRLGENRI